MRAARVIKQTVGSRANRREFLTLAAGGLAFATLGRPQSAAAAEPLPPLPAGSGEVAGAGVQRFHSRPDLLAPQVVIDQPARLPIRGRVITETHLGAPLAGPLIIDPSGRIIWFNPVADKPSAPVKAFNVRVQRYQGRPVLCWFEGVVAGGHGVGYGQGSYKIVDESYREVAQVSAQNGFQGDLHEFLLTPQGTALFTCYGQSTGQIRVGGTMRTVPYYFGVVQEVDVASGKLLWQWRSDHHVRLSESYATPVLKPGWIWDYMHINSITVDPSDQNLIVSGRNTSTCYKINRRSGRIMWRLGGKHSDFRMGRGTRFNYQHDVEMHPGGVLSVFDNEGGPPQFAAHSRALVLLVDERRRQVRLKHAFHHHPPVYSNALGSVQPLGGDTWFVGWGRSTSFAQYAGSGALQFEGHLSPGSSSYRAFLQQWDGRPTAPPDIAVTRSGSAATVYASWNGSTEVAQWIVLGGSTPSTLAQLGRAALAGFETAIMLTNAPPYLAVSACAADGSVLGTSHVVTGG